MIYLIIYINLAAAVSFEPDNVGSLLTEHQDTSLVEEFPDQTESLVNHAYCQVVDML